MAMIAAGVAARLPRSAGLGSLSQEPRGSGAGARIVVDQAPQPGLQPASDPFLFPTVGLQQAIEVGPESKTR
ncbi:TPA: hypothetical protein QDC55_001629 [Burkholderia cenocepacia]|uniref:hypothetical protein n=1 Tax=Burkholderia cenocepacia TaxID=95486 RepID=UPI001CF3E7C2|nr:hypothetical protein [Burkholderia cenocepacia]MCA8405634.1 hypothetical protein [Burkholderia cenocepacia]HDR9828100.1 hypothetical protein [Burkholderia cenocepacia]